MLSKTEFEAYSAIVDLLRALYRKFYEELYVNRNSFSDNDYNKVAIIVCTNFKHRLVELIEKYVESAVKIRYKETHSILTEKIYKNPLDLTSYLNKLKSTLNDQFKGSTLSNRASYIANVLYTETLKYRENRGLVRYKSMFKEFRFLTMIANLSARLLFSEVKRLEMSTTLLMCKDSSVEYLRWLPPTKKKNRKEDICDEYSKYIDESIDIEDKSGIFRIEDYPEYPHPNCNCKIEII